MTDSPITCPYDARDAADAAAERGDVAAAIRLYRLATVLANAQRRTLRGVSVRR